MNKKYDEKIIEVVVGKYAKGQAVSLPSNEHEIPRNTIYFWLKNHKKLKSRDKVEISHRDYYDLQRRAEKLEERLKVIKAAECSLSAPLQEKLEALEKLHGQHSVRALCDALEVSRGTFYNHVYRRNKVTQHDMRREEIREQVRLVFDDSKQRFGSRKIHAILAERGIRVSTGYIVELMREMGLQSVGRHSKKEHQKKTILLKRQDKLKQQFNVPEPNKIWVSDVTCFKVKDKYYYICVIIDLFSRKVIAYGVSPINSTYLITSTLKRALKDRNYPKQLTFHSDRGSQYTSKAFSNLLHMNKVVQSFSRSGQPLDNAVAEGFFSTLKKEELYRVDFKSEQEFRGNVDDYIVFYNTKRPHGTLAYKTPERFETIFQEKQNV